MQALGRTAAAAARKGRTTLSRQTRRYAHDDHSHGHGHSVGESIGTSFWIFAGFVPASFALYFASRQDPNSPSYFTRLIDSYAEIQDKWATRNDLHVRMIEQAGSDRVLFMHSKPNDHYEMKFPEIMNTGSPYNVPAGSIVNMDKVIEKYKKISNEENERKLEALREGTIKSEQPFERLQFPGPSEENKKWPN